MSTSKRLTQVFRSAKEVPFDDSSRFVLFSDCHRGDGGWADDFAHNQGVFFHALRHYYSNGFTYIQIGDGDELWENTRFADIKRTYSNIFWLMSKFYEEGRLFLIWGNHDATLRDPRNVRKALYCSYDETTQNSEPLFEGVEVFEGLVLRYTPTGNRIFLVHGHQGDLINDRLWRVGRFFVRYFWRNLQLLGVRDPTSPAKNFRKRLKVERRIADWVTANDQMLIAGHTHRPTFPAEGAPPYLNDGSCVHPRCITGIEIQDAEISLIKWSVTPDERGALYVTREVLAGPRKLRSLFA